jgi:two-component system sensor histidine kinase UhpB
MVINRATCVPFAEFFAFAVSNALSGLVGGVPVLTPSSYNYCMKPSARSPRNNLIDRHQASQALITELEGRLTQLTSQLLATNASLKREITDRLSKEEEFGRSTEQLRELSARLQSVREEERTHLARTIHDELGQALTGLKMDVAWLQKHLDQQQLALLEKTEAMSDLIDVIVQAVRRIATELRPGILDLSLVATIEWQLQEFQNRFGIHGKLVSAPEETTLDADGATTVFRIFQEILTNVTRHAQATRIEVSLEENDTFLTLQVQDNGRGITESEIHSPKSIGLLGMQERARLRAGEVHFQGAPGQGTTVTVRLPLSTTG